MPAANYPSKMPGSSRARIRELLDKYQDIREPSEEDLLSEEAIEELPEQVPAPPSGRTAAVQEDARRLAAVEQGALSPESYIENEPIPNPEQFEMEAMYGETPSLHQRQRDVAQAVVGESPTWTGGGGWEYELHGENTESPYIVATSPSGKVTRVSPGVKNGKGQDVFKAILEERERLESGEPAPAKRAPKSLEGEKSGVSEGEPLPQTKQEEVKSQEESAPVSDLESQEESAPVSDLEDYTAGTSDQPSALAPSLEKAAAEYAKGSTLESLQPPALPKLSPGQVRAKAKADAERFTKNPGNIAAAMSIAENYGIDHPEYHHYIYQLSTSEG